MKLAVAQIRPIVGPLHANLDMHERAAKLAARQHARLVVFPELSLTGYEPQRALALATDLNDSGFLKLQHLADSLAISLCVGVPLRTGGLPQIAAVTLRPSSSPLIYAKHHLHQDEVPYFAAGFSSNAEIYRHPSVFLAICYELSIHSHTESAIEHGASIFVASVAKTVDGLVKAKIRLADIARQHSIPVMMANCVGPMDGVVSGGGSAAWNRAGNCLGQLEPDSAGVLVMDIIRESCVIATW